MILPALLAAALAAADPCAACSCAGRPTVEDALGSSGAVFTGTVVGVRTTVVRTEHGPWRQRLVRLRVDAAWKGVSAPVVTVRTGMGGGDCGFEFRRGARYLVYAHADPRGRLTAGLCSRTVHAERAQEDLSVLGPPEREWPGPQRREKRVGASPGAEASNGRGDRIA